jgi:hypothetical protein
MERLAADPELAQMLGKNSVRVREKLAVDAVVRQWLDVING